MFLYSDSMTDLDPLELAGFLAHWDFEPPAGTLFQLLSNSDEVILVRDKETPKVCGYIAALSDRVACGYISAFEVRAEYQHMGIGTTLLKRMVERLDVFGVYLSCAPEMISFYESAGFAQGIAMNRRK